MKRSLGNSDSLGSLITICPSTTDEQSPRNNMYIREFQSMLEGLDEEGCVEETGHHHSEKKRRLSVEQVKALEKNFDVENKLEPERKMRLAQELGLQPRQVAVWFQNRRARWKTKNLEKDYGVLKANYDALTLNHDALKQDNEALLKKIKELKSKLQEEDINPASTISVKEEITMMPHDSENKVIEHCSPSPKASNPGSESKDRLNYDCFNNNSDGVEAAFKDGASDSDSSAILNEHNNRLKVIDSSSAVLQSHHQLFMSLESSSTSSVNCFEFQKSYQSMQYVKMEEHNFLSAEEACNFFSDEQAPTLHWYSLNQWSC